MFIICLKKEKQKSKKHSKIEFLNFIFVKLKITAVSSLFTDGNRTGVGMDETESD